jgi:hypothetical protein
MAHFIHDTTKWLVVGGACVAAACGGEPAAEDAPRATVIAMHVDHFQLANGLRLSLFRENWLF